jgi:hypothetical protein
MNEPLPVLEAPDSPDPDTVMSFSLELFIMIEGTWTSIRITFVAGTVVAVAVAV